MFVQNGVMEGALAAGIATGFAVGGAFLLMRLKAWPAAMAIGALGSGCLALATIGIGIAGLASFRGGGDAVIAGMTALVLLVAGLGAAILVGGIIALAQSGRIGQSWLSTLLTISPEPLLIIAAAWFFQAQVTHPMERRTTDTWIQHEQARRAKLDRLKNDIPSKYREYDLTTVDAIERNERIAAQYGNQIKPTFPPGVANKIKNYWQATMEPQPIPDRSGYQRAQEARSEFQKGLGIGWIASSMAAPLALKRRPRPVRKPPVLKQAEPEATPEPPGFEV